MPTTVYRNTDEATAGQLSHEHYRMLVEGSAISPEIVAESGARTIRRGSELPKVFSARQRRRAPGILFPAHRPNGETSWCFRPDRPIEGREGHKYEQPAKALGGAGNVLDVLPAERHKISDTKVPIILCEGAKKMLSLVTAAREAGEEVLVISVTGCWNFLHKPSGRSEPIADLEGLPLQGRRITVMYDSDMLRKVQVQGAVRRLAEYLQGRGAEPYVTYFDDLPSGEKCGPDDFFAKKKGTFAQLRLLTRRYDPADFELIRLSRDERLRSGIQDLWRRLWNAAWSGMGAASDRDVFVVLIEAAKKHGKVVEDGIRVEMAQGPLALEAKVSTRTLYKAIRRLEERGVLYRDNEGRKPDRSGAFVMRANVSHYENNRASEDNETHSETAMYARDLHLRGQLRCPRLRWSQPRYTPKRGLVSGSRKVRQAPRLQSRPSIKRLGKVRGSIIDALDAAGGTLTLKRIAEILHKRRPRDIRRRNLPMLEHAGIVEVNGDQVSLSANWLEELQEQRRLGKETDSRVVLTYEDGRERVRERVVAVEGIETIARRRYEIKRDAYREYLQGKRSTKRKTDRGRSEASVESVKLSHDARDAWLAAQAAKPEPTTYLTAEQSARVDTLVSQGMKEEFAVAEVTRTVSLFDERPKPKPERKMPPKRNGIYVHAAECDCWLCSSEASEEIETGNRRAG